MTENALKEITERIGEAIYAVMIQLQEHDLLKCARKDEPILKLTVETAMIRARIEIELKAFRPNIDMVDEEVTAEMREKMRQWYDVAYKGLPWPTPIRYSKHPWKGKP